MSRKNGGTEDSGDLYSRHLNIMKQIESTSNRNSTKDGKCNIKNLPTVADYNELRKAYKFVMPSLPKNLEDESTPSSDGKMRWQERMARHYHAHLFKSFAIADLSQLSLSNTSISNVPSNENIKSKRRIGLRWRTGREVREGIGQFTCGNKHCPSFRTIVPYDKNRMEIYLQESNKDVKRSNVGRKDQSSIALEEWDQAKQEEEEERNLLESTFMHGMGLYSYEVNFQYIEEKQQKNELVKLRLCMNCAPLLFADKGGALGAKRAREKSDTGQDEIQSNMKSNLDKSKIDEERLKRKKRHTNKKRKKRKK